MIDQIEQAVRDDILELFPDTIFVSLKELEENESEQIFNEDQEGTGSDHTDQGDDA